MTFACEGKQIMAPKEMFGYSEVKKEIEDSVFDNSVPVTVMTILRTTIVP